jgi:hypothetical protein
VCFRLRPSKGDAGRALLRLRGRKEGTRAKRHKPVVVGQPRSVLLEIEPKATNQSSCVVEEDVPSAVSPESYASPHSRRGSIYRGAAMISTVKPRTPPPGKNGAIAGFA